MGAKMKISGSGIKRVKFAPPDGVTIILTSKQIVSLNIKDWMKSHGIPDPGQPGFMPLETSDGLDWGHPFLSIWIIADLFNAQNGSFGQKERATDA